MTANLKKQIKNIADKKLAKADKVYFSFTGECAGKIVPSIKGKVLAFSYLMLCNGTVDITLTKRGCYIQEFNDDDNGVILRTQPSLYKIILNDWCDNYSHAVR